MWVRCSDVAGLTDAQLAYWQSLGVGGFVCMSQWLDGMGGQNAFTDPAGDLTAPQYTLERAIVTSNVVARAHAHNLTLYLGAYLVNYYDTQTPLAEWFDDGAWSGTVVPSASRFASAAHLMGFDGLGFDEELYPQTGGAHGATWSWNYPGNTHTEQQVRAQVAVRGAQLMGAIVGAFPGVEIVDYGTFLPGTWAAYIQTAVNGTPSPYQDTVQLNLWDGLTQAPGYSAIRFLDASFYKGPNVPGAGYDAALQYNDNTWFALLSRSWHNWAYAADRVFVSPFAWIDGDAANEGPWSAPRPPAFVATQLQEYRRWGMGGDFGIYSYASLGQFDYSPYASAMQAAAAPGVVQTQPPTIGVTAPPTTTAAASVSLTGVANDPLAVRVVRWSNDRGGSGTAQLTWQVLGGSDSQGWTAQTTWAAASVPLSSGLNTITLTVENIKGLTTTTSLAITSSAGSGSASGGNPSGGSAPGSPGSLATRLAGSDRVHTAIAVAQSMFAKADTAGAVVLARDDQFADALAGTPLAVSHHAPILTTGPSALDPDTKAEIVRVLAPGGTVYVLGGPSAIDPGMDAVLQGLGYHVIRYGGPDRYATAAVIDRSLGQPHLVLLANGDNFPDALSAGAAAAAHGGVVALTQGASMPAATAAYLAEHPSSSVLAVGGPAAAADPAAPSIVGADRYATAALVAARLFASPSVVGLTSGSAFPDALFGGVQVAAAGGPMVLTSPGSLPAATAAYLHSDASHLTALLVYGGANAVSDQVVAAASQASR